MAPRTRDPASQPRRADAQRNRGRILKAARYAFASDGETSLAEISRRAGVSMATLYRNFDGRQELLETVYADEVDAVCAAAEQHAGDPPDDALSAWLEAVFRFLTAKRPIGAELLAYTGRPNPIFSLSRARIVAAGQPLWDAAYAAGTVDPCLSLDQAIDLIGAIAHINADQTHVTPILRAGLRGLGTSAASGVSQARKKRPPNEAVAEA